MALSSRPLGECLVELKVLSRDSMEAMLERERTENVPLARLLLTADLVSEKDLVAAIARQVGVPFIDFSAVALNPDVDRFLSAEVARAHQVVPVRLDDGALVVAMADPSDATAIKALGEATGRAIRPAIAERAEIAQVIAAVYGRERGSSGDERELRVTVEQERPARPLQDAEAAEELSINELLERVVDLGASDLHVTVGISPTVRINGELKPLTEYPPMNGSDLRRMIYGILTQKQREKFEEELELDTSHTVPGKGRFRVNVFLQRNSIGAVMRAIPFEIVPLDKLNMPPIIASLAAIPRGLVLVTGPTGSGKSTTLASLIDIINQSQAVHIMTVEDPIEFLHRHKRSVVNQREVGEDTASFANALKHVLRQDPDVILVGEMRDLETIGTAITAAETGHLVFATLHTQDAPQSIDRVIDVFPAHQQQQIRVQLAASLQAVVTQQLLPLRNGKGRTVAVEVLIATPAVRNLIREAKTHQIYSTMQSGGKFGMQTMDQSLAALVKSGAVDLEVALERAHNEDDVRQLLARG